MKIFSLAILVISAVAVGLAIWSAYFFYEPVPCVGEGPTVMCAQVVPSRLMPFWGPLVLLLAWAGALRLHIRGKFLQSIILGVVIVVALLASWYFGSRGLFGLY